MRRSRIGNGVHHLGPEGVEGDDERVLVLGRRSNRRSGDEQAGQEEGEAPRLALAAAPNPAVGGSEIRFTLEQEASVRLSLFDASGRRVRELVRGSLAAGPHRIAWDGRTDAGSRAGAGVYLVKLETASSTRAMKLAWMGP